MDWWSGMNPCAAVGDPSSTPSVAAVAAASAVDAGPIFDPWINYDDLDLSTILNQAPPVSISNNNNNNNSTSAQASNILGSSSQVSCSSSTDQPARKQAIICADQPVVVVGSSCAYSDTNTSDTSSNNVGTTMVYSSNNVGTTMVYPLPQQQQAEAICSPSGNLEEATNNSNSEHHQQQQQQQLICSPGGGHTQQDSKHNLFNVITNHFSAGGQHPQFQEHLHHQNHHQHQASRKVRRCRHITDYVLAEEEKRLLIKEGYTDFPMNCQTRPLSKSEERILRKIRRKIRNKKSAQCSRQRKKEYVEDLERKYAAVVRENEELKQVIESIEQFQSNHNHHLYQHEHIK